MKNRFDKAIVLVVAACATAFFVLAGAANAAAADQSPMTEGQMITPADFTPVEANFYKTLDLASAKDFIATRSYVRLCQAVVNHTLPAIQLPDRPAGFSAKYLLPEDPTVLNTALADYLVARDDPNHQTYRLAPDMSAEQTMKPSDLTSVELTRYKQLDPAAAHNFIITRSFVRLCKQVLARSLAPEKLPVEPIGFSGAYLLKGETAEISKATTESILALMHRHPDALNHIGSQ